MVALRTLCIRLPVLFLLALLGCALTDPAAAVPRPQASAGSSHGHHHHHHHPGAGGREWGPYGASSWYCPPADEAGNGMSDATVAGDVFTCEYGLEEGGISACMYSLALGGLVDDEDGSFCPAYADNTSGAARRRRAGPADTNFTAMQRKVAARAALPQASRAVPSFMQTRSALRRHGSR